MTPDTSNLTGEMLAEVKRDRLQYTVEYAYEHSPFYRELMADHGVDPADIRTFDDLQRLPIVTGQDIRDNQPPNTAEHRFRTKPGNLHRPFATSGSTGQPKLIYKSHDEIDQWTGTYDRILDHFGITGDDVIVNYCPYVGLNASGFCTEETYREYGYSTVPLLHSQMAVDQQAHFIRTHDVSVLMTLPSHAHARGHQFLEAGYDPAGFGIEKITVGGEAFSDARREEIEEIWDAELYDMLGISECGIVGAECTAPDDHRLHILDDKTHVEVVDDAGNRCAPGERGHLTVTNLLEVGSDSSMPLIRYQTGDLTSLYDSDCGCELHDRPLIDQPRRDGWQFNFGAVVLDVLYFEDVVYDHPALDDDVTDYQLYLDSDGEHNSDRLELRIVTSEGTHVGEEAIDVTVEEVPNVAAEVGQSLLQKRSTVHETVDIVDAAQIDVRFVESIEHSRGKPDRLIDNRDQ